MSGEIGYRDDGQCVAADDAQALHPPAQRPQDLQLPRHPPRRVLVLRVRGALAREPQEGVELETNLREV